MFINSFSKICIAIHVYAVTCTKLIYTHNVSNVENVSANQNIWINQYNEGMNALYGQASNSYFWLLLASNLVKFYSDSSNYPFHDLSKVSNNYCYRYNVIGQNQSFFLSSKRMRSFFVMHQKLLSSSFGKNFTIISHESTHLNTLI